MKNNERTESAPNKVATGCLTARDVLRNAFACTNSVTDDELLVEISSVLNATHSLNLNAKVVSNAAGELLQKFWSDFQLLNEMDQEDVAVTLLARFEQSGTVRRAGRPKGSKGKDTEQRIRLVAALCHLGCSRPGMVSFIYPTQYREQVGKYALNKLLKRQAILIQEESAKMSKSLAIEAVKSNVTMKLAQRIVQCDT